MPRPCPTQFNNGIFPLMVKDFLTHKIRIVFSRTNGTSPYRRGHKRIRLKIRFQVSGQDEHGFPFQTEAETTNVSGKGCCLSLGKDLARGQALRLISARGRLFTARVCWSKYSPERDVRDVGVSLPIFTTGWVIADDARSSKSFSNKVSP